MTNGCTEKISGPPCVWRDGCRNSEVCAIKGYCDAPPAMRRERADLQCDCFGDRPDLWGAACQKFDDDDQGCCYNCGHSEVCHGKP